MPASDPLSRLDRSIVLVGLMGAGKTTIGRRLARRLDLPFFDADEEIEAAAGRTVSEIFSDFGEAAFRDGERKVIARLLSEGPRKVLALGGGAFMSEETRALVKGQALSIWLRAELETLMDRVSRRNTRPLLKTEDPRAVMADLMARRAPVYGEADLIVDVDGATHETTAARLLDALREHAEGVAP
ncbi:MAG: shikimate kinase [Pseudomonadota bacterium]